MNIGRCAWGIVAGLTALFVVGCSAAPSIIRGQNPTATQGSIQQVGDFDGHYAKKGESYGPIETYAGPGGQCADGSCCGQCQGPDGQCGCDKGHGGCSCSLCDHIHSHFHHPVGDWYPTHRHWYHYGVDEHFHDVDSFDDLSYPPANTPAAVVQYPYYTHRGPTDFFMQ